jgi:selenocysteine lyase/cysteine desulfurase/RimJ/RimL family protein N-acetyltransferase
MTPYTPPAIRDGAPIPPVAASYLDDFPDFEGAAYLNAAFQGPMPRVALAALEAATRYKTHSHRFGDEIFYDLPDAYRAEAAAIVGGDPEGIAVSDSTIHVVSSLTAGLDWRAGDEVVLPQGEFPSNRFPWLALERRGVVVREVALADAASAPEALDAATSSRTRVVAVGWVHYSTGRRVDLRAVGEVARRRGALFVVDASQGLGGRPFSLADSPCDLLACSGYKWLLGAYGTGFGWYSPELRERLRPEQMNWFAIRGARDFASLGSCDLAFESTARRFDVNETASYFNVPASTAAMRYVRAVGAERIAAHVDRLNDRLVAGLPAGVRVVSSLDPRYRSNLLCVACDDPAFAPRAKAELARRDVHVTRREGALRVSPHLYNDEADVDRLLDGLAAAVAPASRASVDLGARRPSLLGPPVAGGDARRPARATLAGATIELRPLDAARDLDALYRAGHGDAEREALWDYLPYGPFASRDEMGEWLARCAASDDPLFFAVVPRGGEPIGMASFLNIEHEMRRLEVGHLWYAPEWQRGRANQETVELLLAEAFDRLGYRRAEWKCNSLNQRSRRAAVRLGFSYEGLFRRHMVVKGRNRDSAWYAMTDDEWRSRREARSSPRRRLELAPAKRTLPEVPARMRRVDAEKGDHVHPDPARERRDPARAGEVEAVEARQPLAHRRLGTQKSFERRARVVDARRAKLPRRGKPHERRRLDVGDEQPAPGAEPVGGHGAQAAALGVGGGGVERGEEQGGRRFEVGEDLDQRPGVRRRPPGERGGVEPGDQRRGAAVDSVELARDRRQVARARSGPASLGGVARRHRRRLPLDRFL